jgi:protein-disulfide isomerase
MQEKSPFFQRPFVVSLLIPVIFVLGMGSGYLIWGHKSPATAPAAPAEQTEKLATPTVHVTRYPVPVDDDPSIGPENAAITIIEFSDYQCPYCKKWHDEVLDRLLANYPGQLRFVYRDFPLISIHPGASPAAMAANCAGEQGSYWPFHEALFSMKYDLTTESFQQYAVELGLDTQAFAKCLADQTYESEVMADYNYAANLGISSTPTFFINGIPIVGAQPYDVFRQIIDKELAGEIP